MSNASSWSRADERASLWFFKLGKRLPRSAWKVLEYSGDGILWLILAATLIGIGFSNKLRTVESSYDNNLQDANRPTLAEYSLLMGVNLLIGLVIDLIEVGLLKMIFKRPRPHHNTFAKDMNIIVPVDAFSFPSGHSSRVSFLAQYALLFFPMHHPLNLVVVIWAITVALSRCMMGRHYCSDVFAGLLLGYGTTWLLTKGAMERNSMLCTEECISEMLSKGFAVRQHLKTIPRLLS